MNSFKTPNVIRQHLTIAAITNKLSYSDYRVLAEWLECYQYVLPNDRVLKCIPIINITCSLDALKLWLLCDLIQSTMTGTEQIIFSSTIGIGKDHVTRITS